MPFPEWKKRLPGQQSLSQRLRATLLNNDFVRSFGRSGASATVTTRTTADAPLGPAPPGDRWNQNPEVTEKSTAPATRPPRERGRSDLVR